MSEYLVAIKQNKNNNVIKATEHLVKLVTKEKHNIKYTNKWKLKHFLLRWFLENNCFIKRKKRFGHGLFVNFIDSTIGKL